jgi:hypothetical protein
MPLQQTSGNVTADAYGGGVAVIPNYIEDVFSTYLYTGNGSTQTITNGIDLSTKGGLVWVKTRSAAGNNFLFDTARGVNNEIRSNSNNAQSTVSNSLTAFNSTGFDIGSAVNVANNNAVTYASWTFRKQPKFFDIVTWTGDGTLYNLRNISHSLGSVPGCVIVKATNASGFWWVSSRLSGTSPQYRTWSSYPNYFATNRTDGSYGVHAEGTNFTDTTFNLSGFGETGTIDGQGGTNLAGVTYVAYLFAHNAGGFGLTGTDNVISCGSYTEGASAQEITLGYEPQWLLMKSSSSTSDWYLYDTMRGMSYTQSNPLVPNTSDPEANFGTGFFRPTATGFTALPGYWGSGVSVIYIAIRRGPMKVPTSGTTVYSASQVNSPGGNQVITNNFSADLVLTAQPSAADDGNKWAFDRLRGSSNVTAYTTILATNLTSAEQSAASLGAGNGKGIGFDSNTTIKDNFWSPDWGPNDNIIWWNFKRAPSFFDEVCYTGNGTSNTAIAHNLTAIPELWIVKARNQGTRNWQVYYNLSSSSYARLILNTTDAGTTGIAYNAGTNLYAQPTSTNLYLMNGFPNTSAETYVSYLFATCAGVSKVTNFTGTGALQTINCGFAAGSRFVLIKRTDSTGDWYVWDSSRGLSSSTDPYLLLNSTAAEVTGTNWVDTTATGFQVTAASGNNVNINGASYIALAVA